MKTNDHKGWLLDIYPTTAGAVLWFIAEDGARRRLVQPFPVTFYAAGGESRLRALVNFLSEQTNPPLTEYTRRRDLFLPEPASVLAIHCPSAPAQTACFSQVSRRFPDLTYYDADIHIALHHAAAHSTFPLCACSLKADENAQVSTVFTLNTPWENDLSMPPLRILSLRPDCPPQHAEPSALILHCEKSTWRFPFNPPRPLLVNLAAILNRYDPDILLTEWGDSWLLPKLQALSKKYNQPLPLNRDADKEIQHRPPRTYFSYGQVIFRDQQIHLFGRLHIDIHNAMLYHDYGLEGIFELGRVTSLPLQMVARLSPGSGISAMQMITALRQDILVPWRKQQVERPKTANQLLRSDQGGLVYQPLIGVHRDVAELDFVSMYPSIMTQCNISPETTYRGLPSDQGADDKQAPLGLIPQTLQPLLQKRLALKQNLAFLPHWDPRRKTYKAQASAHKWLLVTCFGYLGYKNARFGRIEAHEAVTAYGREALMRAKEAAEEMGFTVLHLYVDGLWVQKMGCNRPEDFQTLQENITQRCGLPIAIEGIYRWIAFLPSRLDKRVPVPNRFFGVFQDGTLKTRGIEARRRDTPLWIARIQEELLQSLAQMESPGDFPKFHSFINNKLKKHIDELYAGRIPPETLVVSQKLSRPPQDYLTRSPGARAAAQLSAVGKPLRQGQMVKFIYTRDQTGVHAWDLASQLYPGVVDYRRYRELLLRAADTVLEPFLPPTLKTLFE